jgi:ketosteroid isomerase-like protein
MPEDNVEIVREIHAAWEVGSPLDSGHLAPDIEWVNPEDAVETGIRRGIDAFDLAARSVDDTFAHARIEIEELVEAGDRVVVIGTLQIRGSGSGVELGRRQGYVWTLRDGKAIRFEWFNDPDRALAAAGVERR